MNCPKCGAEMKEGSLYCEYCGEDIHIVPDFEPELEYSLEQTLSHIVEDIREENDTDADVLQGKMTTEEKTAQDWDRTDRQKNGGGFRKKRLVVLVTILLLLGTGTLGGIFLYQYFSPDYQITKARLYAANEKYDRAVIYYSRALELEPDSIELKFSLAEIYFLKNNKIEYEYLLRDITRDKNASAEQLESAYGKLIAIYRAREDFKTIQELLLASNNEGIINKYRNYIALEPEFSIKEGYYTSIQPLKLSTFGNGKIYYTLDGSEPDGESMLYTAPILLEDGEYCIKAFYVNENGLSSEVVTKKYHIDIEELPSPEISVISGEYNFPINIEVVSEDNAIYYTMDGSTPTAHSNIYKGPIPMPLGPSTFKFIHIEDGRSSEVVERTYKLTLDTEFTPQQAEEAVIAYCIEIQKIYNANGTFDDTEAAYRYQYQYVTHINNQGVFYVIAEIFKAADGSMTKTGNYFAANAYTGKLYKLQSDGNNYTLVEI